MSTPGRDSFRSRRAYRIERMREGQQRAALKIEICVAGGKQFIAIVLPTRYGKSDVIRATACELIHKGAACCALLLSPNTHLRDQIVDEDKIREMKKRLEPEWGDVKTYTIGGLVLDPGCNGEWLLSANIHLVQRNLQIFGDWVESKVNRTGKTLLVYIDEAHTGSKSNKWGEVARFLARCGATIVLLTATPYRADGDEIYGFRTVTLSEEEYRKVVPSEGSRPDLVKLTVFEGVKRIVKLEPDYEYTLKYAWEEDPLPIAKIEWLPFDVDVKEITKGETRLLSDLKAVEVKGLLGRVVRDPRVIESGVRSMAQKIRELRTKDPSIQGIVFCGNDREEDDEFNAHARTIRDYFGLLAPDLKVVVSTSSSDEDKDDVLAAFCGGAGDVIIVKQRASLGLDRGPLKVGLDLSPVRTRAAFYQRMMRIATVYKNFYGIFICPNETIGSGHFSTIVSENGGEMTVADLEMVSETEVPKKDQSEKPFYDVTGTGDADFGDSDQNWADKGMRTKVEWFRRALPEVIGLMSHAQIAARIEKWHMDIQMPTQDDSEAYGTNLEIFTCRKSIVGKVERMVRWDRKSRGVEKEGDEPYGNTAQSWWRRLYKVAGVTFVPISKQNHLPTLAILDRTASLMLADTCVGGGDEEE